MAVTDAYLEKVRRGVRIQMDIDWDAELIDIIEECRLDLISLGVTPEKANDEADSLILGAVRSFARWKFGLDTDIKNRDDYMLQRDELRRKRDYRSYTITFSVKNESDEAIADAIVTFNGEIKETDSSGNAVFYYVDAGVNQDYSVIADGYTSVASDIDVTATTTISVVMS